MNQLPYIYIYIYSKLEFHNRAGFVVGVWRSVAMPRCCREQGEWFISRHGPCDCLHGTNSATPAGCRCVSLLHFPCPLGWPRDSHPLLPSYISPQPPCSCLCDTAVDVSSQCHDSRSLACMVSLNHDNEVTVTHFEMLL